MHPSHCLHGKESVPSLENERDRKHTREGKNLVTNVDGGIMLAAIQRVLSPGAQVPFHGHGSVLSGPERTIFERAAGMKASNSPSGEFGSCNLRAVQLASAQTVARKQWPVPPRRRCGTIYTSSTLHTGTSIIIQSINELEKVMYGRGLLLFIITPLS